MNTHADKTLENKSQAVANSLPKLQSNGESAFRFVDNRPEAISQRKLQEANNNSPRVQQLKAYQEMVNNSPQVKQLKAYQAMANNFTSQTAQRKENLEEETLQGKFESIQKKANNTGLPDNLKSGIENISSYSLDDVKVHYNSDKPAQLQAHAYAQGADIHLGAGQEKHLPHEAWHVVQQKQGRVKPTLQMKSRVYINDDTGLEKEADVMGTKALSAGSASVQKLAKTNSRTSSSPPIQRAIDHARALVARYANLTGNNYGIGPNSTWAEIQAVEEFSARQRERIEFAMAGFNADGTRVAVHDRSGNVVAGAIAGTGDVDATVEAKERKMNALQANHPVHFQILNMLEDTIIAKFGLGTNLQFWKGAHIVFSDQGVIYQRLSQMGQAIAARKLGGEIKNKTEFAGLTSSNFFGLSSSKHEQRAGRMMERRPGTKETGHYSGTAGGPPQYGIDLPESVKGHLLFGLTADGDTFVQTEAAGFQSFWEGTVVHGMGALTVRGYGAAVGTQSGMVGTSPHSEDPNVQTEIREHENLTWDMYLATVN